MPVPLRLAARGVRAGGSGYVCRASARPRRCGRLRRARLHPEYPLGKRSVRRWTVAPASRRAATTERLSSDSSTKNVTSSSGFEVDFAADRVPDRFFACTVVFRQVGWLVACFETLCKHGGRNPRARNDRPPKRNTRIDYYRTRLIFRRLRAHERVE